MKSGYEEELVDEEFSSHVVTTKRKDLLRNKKRKNNEMKYQNIAWLQIMSPPFRTLGKLLGSSNTS